MNVLQISECLLQSMVALNIKNLGFLQSPDVDSLKFFAKYHETGWSWKNGGQNGLESIVVLDKQNSLVHVQTL